MKLLIKLSLFAVVLGLAGCKTTGQTLGGLGGAGGGAALAQKFLGKKQQSWGVPAGAVAGAALGMGVGSLFDGDDEEEPRQTQNRRQTQQVNRQGYQGYQQPVYQVGRSANFDPYPPTYYGPQIVVVERPQPVLLTRVCREYEEEVWVGPRAHLRRGVACLQADQSWRVVQ